MGPFYHLQGITFLERREESSLAIDLRVGWWLAIENCRDISHC